MMKLSDNLKNMEKFLDLLKELTRVAPITQILIYNLALDFKFSKSKFTK